MPNHTTHRIDIDAPVGVVYGIIADATAWPQHFAPTIHVERSEIDSSTERLRIWADANGEVKNWTSVRSLDESGHRIGFRQEVSSPPVASMSGEWIITSRGDGATLTLTHDFEAAGGDPAGAEWITEATDRNSEKELANIKTLAEAWDRVGELVFSFEDSVLVDGSLDDIYDFLHDAGRWPERLPHVSRLELTEDVPHLQVMVMDTLAKDGSTHTTESVRVCYPGERIVYKQLVTPSLMAAHVGEWIFEQAGHSVRVTSWHRVTVREAMIAEVLGPDATVATARDFIRKAAGGNSAATLALAKKFTEAVHA